jgi:uncharacterized protein (TIRG00374 family)
MRRSTITRLVKVVVSLALLAAILAHVGPRAVAAQIGGMNKSLVALALALLLAESLLRSLNWFQLIRSGTQNAALRCITYAYFVGGFFGALVPSTLGTDLARSTVAGIRTKASVETYFATTVLLNLLSLMVICAAALIACALVLDWPNAPAATIAASAGVSSACLLGISVLYVLARQARAPRAETPPAAAAKWRSGLKRRLARFLAALVMLPRGVELAAVVFVAACSYALRSLGWLTLLAAADASISWAVLLTIGPLVTLGAALPISVLGFGGFQAISVYLLAQWDVPTQQALAASIVQSGLAVLICCIGCVVYIAGDRVSLASLSAADRANEEYSG